MVEAGSYITSIIAGGVYSIADGAFDLYCIHYSTRAYILTCVLFHYNYTCTVYKIKT